ncbi:MAG TPA: cytochrome C oxidase subunit IV family protein [Anaerolineaceae bacterium]|nr:cytochrome C oxidase subunit IV family protein [Anaerolineaceae bacterium]
MAEGTLFRTWLLLVGLTLASLAAAFGLERGEGGMIAAAVALVAAYVKCRAVLDHFLGLRTAGAGWRGFFSALLLVLLGGLMATYVASGFHP